MALKFEYSVRSDLQAQLQSVNNSLNAVHQQNNKMEQKISQMEKDHAVATKTAATHHRATVRSIEEKVHRQIESD